MSVKTNRTKNRRKSIKNLQHNTTTNSSLSYIYMTGDSGNENFAFVKFTSKDVEIFYKINTNNSSIEKLLEQSYDNDIFEYSQYEDIIRKNSGANLVYNYKKAFIPSYTWGNDVKTKQLYKHQIVKLGNKKLTYTIVDKSIQQIPNMLGEFIVIELDKHHYLSLSYNGINDFHILDDIIYCSQGASTRSGSQMPFMIGTKYTYLITELESFGEPHFYIANDVMKEFNEIDPNKLIHNKDGEILKLQKGFIFDKKIKTQYKMERLKSTRINFG